VFLKVHSLFERIPIKSHWPLSCPGRLSPPRAISAGGSTGIIP
jgi:hypothetical protein